MQIWRIIRAILFVIFAAICVVAGYFDYKYGNLSNKAMYVTFIICLVLCFPSLVKDIASPYKGKKEPKKFVRRRLLFNTVSSAVLGVGTYLLIGLKPDALAVLESQMGVEGVLVPLIFFAIFMVVYLIIELLMFYLPRRLGLHEEYESEEEEQKINNTAAIMTAVIILFSVAVFVAAELIPGFYEYISSDLLVAIVAFIITIGVFLYLRKNID